MRIALAIIMLLVAATAQADISTFVVPAEDGQLILQMDDTGDGKPFAVCTDETGGRVEGNGWTLLVPIGGIPPTAIVIVDSCPEQMAALKVHPDLVWIEDVLGGEAPVVSWLKWFAPGEAWAAAVKAPERGGADKTKLEKAKEEWVKKKPAAKVNKWFADLKGADKAKRVKAMLELHDVSAEQYRLAVGR